MNAGMSFYASTDPAGAGTAERDIRNIFGTSAGFLTCEDDFPEAIGERFTDTRGRFPMTEIVEALRKDTELPGSEFWFAHVRGGTAQVPREAKYLTVGLDDSPEGYHLRRQYGTTEHRYLATVQPA
ncbi:hypothetical protein [Kineosporia babensis]|uniref:Uncharacterized protein n=1 Tax=Kineosporia babensis TaxID=499548 RepID=A0A9X1N9X4_9ACTN|nr:hypothetical protein [Kineosporia babensis]MCD5311282.1 hypothetical protein [Kineosporia babensis]